MLYFSLHAIALEADRENEAGECPTARRGMRWYGGERSHWRWKWRVDRGDMRHFR